MPDIHIHRRHRLGLAKARKIAWSWAEEVERRFGMECTVLEGEDGDTVEFQRAGVNGELRVAADEFELQAKLGLFMSVFAGRIRSEVETQLDALLASEAASPAPAAAKKAAAKKAAAPAGASRKPAAKAPSRKAAAATGKAGGKKA